MYKQWRTVLALALALLLSNAPAAPQTGPFCPIIPQISRLAATSKVESYSTDGVLDFSGSNLRPSIRLRVSNAGPSDLVFIDGKTLEDAASVEAVRKSKAVIMLKTQHGPEFAHRLFDQRVARIDVWAAIPENEAGVAQTYRSTTAQFPSVVKEYASVAGELRKLPKTRVLSASSGGKSIRELLLSEASADRPNDLLVIVAHNVTGELKLPDGTAVTTAEIAQAGTKHSRPVLVLSCDTLNTNSANPTFVTTRPLHFDEIHAAIEKSLGLMNTNPQQTNVGAVVRQMNLALDKDQADKTRTGVIAVALIAVSVFAIVLVAAESCRRDQDGKCK